MLRAVVAPDLLARAWTQDQDFLSYSRASVADDFLESTATMV
jgi:hypothetical protein